MRGHNPTEQWIRYHHTPAMFNLPLVISRLVVSYFLDKCSQLAMVGQIQSLNHVYQEDLMPVANPPWYYLLYICNGISCVTLLFRY
jgi:hypothetical protein